MEVPHDGCPAEHRCGNKQSAILRNYKADAYEEWQFWLERDTVKCICFSFSNWSEFSSCQSSVRGLSLLAATMMRSESSVIPFLVPGRKVLLTPTARMPCSNAANIGECKTWTQSEICTWQNCVPGKIPLRGKSPQKSVLAQEMAKHRAKFGWPPLSDGAAVRKSRRKTRWKFAGCSKLANRSKMLVGQVHHIVRTCGGDIGV